MSNRKTHWERVYTEKTHERLDEALWSHKRSNSSNTRVNFSRMHSRPRNYSQLAART
jgi:hypothetical protein